MADTAPIPVDAPIERRIALAVERWGEADVVAKAIELAGGVHVAEEYLLVVGGDHAKGILEGAPVLYWPELWGVRALLYVWDDSAVDAVTGALHNQAWRVREMAARVAAARGLRRRAGAHRAAAGRDAARAGRCGAGARCARR